MKKTTKTTIFRVSRPTMNLGQSSYLRIRWILNRDSFSFYQRVPQPVQMFLGMHIFWILYVCFIYVLFTHIIQRSTKCVIKSPLSGGCRIQHHAQSIPASTVLHQGAQRGQGLHQGTVVQLGRSNNCITVWVRCQVCCIFVFLQKKIIRFVFFVWCLLN